MLETKCVGDNFDMLVTVLAVFVTNISRLNSGNFGIFDPEKLNSNDLSQILIVE